MSKGTYRSRPVKVLDWDRVALESRGRIVVAVDVAKERQYASFMTDRKEVLVTVTWKHPEETPEFLSGCARLRALGVKVEAAMEPTGTYGDAIRAGLLDRGVEVYRVAGKRVNDSRELRDGVPSLHDAKAAQLVGWLHLEGASEPWPLRSEWEREVRAGRDMMAMWQERVQTALGRLEAKLARHWPEATQHLELTSAALHALLAEYGSPAAVAAAGMQAVKLLRKVGRSFLSEDKALALVESARSTQGLPMTPLERKYVRGLAADIVQSAKAQREAEGNLVALTREQIPREASALVGAPTAAMLVASGADPSQYKSAAAFQKAIGLNLREKSSGKEKGRLHISKRGDADVRQSLFMATLRLIKVNAVVRAWYIRKVSRDGGRVSKINAVVAVERKLALALWHVWTEAEAFDASKLFDVSRLAQELRRMGEAQAV